MTEKSEDPFKIKDPSVLTWVEHKLIGSTVDRPDMVRNPFKPQAVLDGKTPFEVAADRIALREIKSMDSESFGLPFGKLPLVRLGHMNWSTGEVEKVLVLLGIFDLETEDIERNPIELAKYKLTDEGRQKYGLEGKVSVMEKKG
jgi:hypothetical protein